MVQPEMMMMTMMLLLKQTDAVSVILLSTDIVHNGKIMLYCVLFSGFCQQLRCIFV